MRKLDNVKMEIDRAYRVLGQEKGFMQNQTDLYHLRREQIITHEEYQELLEYNREKHR